MEFNLDPEDNEDEFDKKIMAALLAFLAVSAAILVITVCWSILVGFWHAGFLVTAIWFIAGFSFFYIGRIFYRIIIKNGWMDKI